MKRKIMFPPIETANEDGLVAVGGDLNLDTLLEAYQNGIFPWPLSTYPLNANLPNTWFSPDPRGILDFTQLHVSRSFLKFLKKTPYSVTFNRAFPEIIEHCAKIIRKGQPGTWITPGIIDAYINLFHHGFAYSVEVWENDEIMAGMYGVIIGTFISGESMFTYRDNASKQGLYTLVHHLGEKGISWLDTQMVTEVVRQFGGSYIPRTNFIQRLEGVDWSRDRSEFF